MAAVSQNGWSLNQGAFTRLLVWLDEGIDSNGEKYLEMRRRLVCYFARKNCLSPDELADETLNRVARRLTEAGDITDASPARYCYIVAKFVFLEDCRKPKRVEVDLERAGDFQSPDGSNPGADADGPVYRLRKCLDTLTPENRALILEYYHGEKKSKIGNRRRLASKLGLSMNALAIRACRIRDGLEDCMKKSSAGESA
jgi:DNA-directed RNA polymerase specialized sigma24 family protein